MEVNKFRSKRKRGRRSFLAGESLGRTTSITQAGQAGGATVAAKRVDFNFTADSRLESLTRYNSTTAAPANLVASSAFAYDNLGRLSTLSHSKNSTTIATYGFTYDASTQIASIAATSQVGVSGTSNFSYDATGQLTTTDHTHITDKAYAYDTSGNRTGSGITIGTNIRMSTDGTFNYTYDNEGNLTVRTRISTANANDKTITYTWDHRNRLTSIVYKNNAGTKTKEAIYEYDVFDRRTKKSVDLDGAGSGAAVVSRYVYDGEDILATTNSSGTVTSRLLHGPAVDQILAIETASNGAVHWALTDQLGSVRDIVDNSGNVANHIVYDSFGNVASETASSVDYLFGFTGRERDEESDLNYHRARYYSSSIGRWLSEDPIGFSAGDTNLRRYVNNDPVNAVDPSGNDTVKIQSTYDEDLWHLDSTVVDSEFKLGGWTRVLTPGEHELLHSIYGDYMDYSKVRIGLHPISPHEPTKAVAGTPRNTIWYNAFYYTGDFSKANAKTKTFFIHESFHVLQSQQGNWNVIQFLILTSYYGSDYDPLAYQFDEKRLGSPLCEFNMEQQAVIVQQFYGEGANPRLSDEYRETIDGFQTLPPPTPGWNPKPGTPVYPYNTYFP